MSGIEGKVVAVTGGIACAIEQPKDVDTNEITQRPTAQPL
jgi:hypothetical protein